jgi:hypothetical protein
MTVSTPDELIAGFPHNSLPKVTGEPTFEDLKIIHHYLNTNQSKPTAAPSVSLLFSNSISDPEFTGTLNTYICCPRLFGGTSILS